LVLKPEWRGLSVEAGDECKNPKSHTATVKTTIQGATTGDKQLKKNGGGGGENVAGWLGGKGLGSTSNILCCILRLYSIVRMVEECQGVSSNYCIYVFVF